MTERPDDAAIAVAPQRRRTGRAASVLIFLCVTMLSLAGGALYYLHWSFNRAGPLAADTAVVVPRGASTAEIARLLDENDVIADPQLFLVGTRLFGGQAPLRAGEYAFPAGASARDAVRILQTADPVVHRLTIPEGWTTAEVLALVSAAAALSGETPTAEEGSLLPETFHFQRGDSRAELVARMRSDLQATLDELWDGRDEGLPFADTRAALILASIVEKETAVPEERARVAAVFINRLKRGMKLQSDPTVAYALTGGNGVLERALLRADLKRDHPYNTYVIAGLPPGPIANPGRASLEAVMHPADTKDLYFVADGKGGHAFAETLAEHNRNVARWRKVQRQYRNAKP
ncbi:MAG: endolytic transglycosylase MltG [Alphaproteobacteria bacterium]